MGKDKVVPFLLEDRMKELGGAYTAGPDWQPHAGTRRRWGGAGGDGGLCSPGDGAVPRVHTHGCGQWLFQAHTWLRGAGQH